MEMLQGVWKQHLRLRAVVGYGVKIFLPSPPNYVTRSPGSLPFTQQQGGQSTYRSLMPKFGFIKQVDKAQVTTVKDGGNSTFISSFDN